MRRPVDVEPRKTGDGLGGDGLPEVEAGGTGWTGGSSGLLIEAHMEGNAIARVVLVHRCTMRMLRRAHGRACAGDEVDTDIAVAV
jgi:hypothetical protein